MTMELTNQLLPCPFCGEVPRLIHWMNWKGVPTGNVNVMCENGDCPVEVRTREYKSEQAAIERWNTRINQDAPSEYPEHAQDGQKER